MRYDVLAQQALRGVVRAALKRVERDGLPGEHHFYVAFDTTHPQTKVSDRLKRKYPEEMTVVLQHQFWGLDVHSDWFTVELSFDNIPEKMEIPFAAVKGFFDPYIQFGLQFEMDEANQNLADNDSRTGESGNLNEVDGGEAAVAGETKDDTSEEVSKTVETPTSDNDDNDTAPTPPKAANEDDVENQDEDGENEGEKVISLDAFRKK